MHLVSYPWWMPMHHASFTQIKTTLSAIMVLQDPFKDIAEVGDSLYNLMMLWASIFDVQGITLTKVA